MRCNSIHYISSERDQDFSVSTETSWESHQAKIENRRQRSSTTTIASSISILKGKVRWLLHYIFFLNVMVCSASAVSIMPKLKQNVLRFGYGVNFRYEGMLAHSFDRFYVVTKVELPKVSDLNLTMFQFDYNCSHVTKFERIRIGFNFRVTNTM